MVEISNIQLCCIDHPGPYKWSVAHCRRYAVSDRSIDWRHRIDLISAHSPRLAVAAQSRSRRLSMNPYCNPRGHRCSVTRTSLHTGTPISCRIHHLASLHLVVCRESRAPLSSPSRATQQSLTSRHSSQSTGRPPNPECLPAAHTSAHTPQHPPG